MTKYLIELRPERIEDIMAMVALYRPGPIESIPEYIKRKHDPSLISFLDKRMKDILKMSYGVIVYQDDVMLIAIHLGGYSWLEADKLRKAMGKKIPEEMALQKIKLLEGFVKHGLSNSKANQLWKLIEPFAAYGFNKAHAASYGMVAYETAFMKANYPAEYMTALMTAESGDLEKIAEAVAECERMGIAVLPPDVNESLKDFTYISDTQIRFGLLVIKNLGEEVVESLIAERKQNGPFKDLADFTARLSHRAFNKKSFEALAKSGALDRFGERKQLLENTDRILMFNKNAQREKTSNQVSLFAAAPSVMHTDISLRAVQPATTHELLVWEKEILGLYVSAHPFEVAAKTFGSLLTPLDKIKTTGDGVFIRAGGIITLVKEIMTKKGAAMAFVSLQDLSGTQETVVFPEVYARSKDLLKADELVLLSAKTSHRNGEVGLLANSFIRFQDEQVPALAQMLQQGQWMMAEDLREDVPEVKQDRAIEKTILHRGALSIVLQGKPTAEMVNELRGILQSAPGPKPVCLLVESGGQVRQIQTDYSVSISETIVDEIAALVGRQNVSVT